MSWNKDVDIEKKKDGGLESKNSRKWLSPRWIRRLGGILSFAVLSVSLIGGIFYLLITDPSGDAGGPLFLIMAIPILVGVCALAMVGYVGFMDFLHGLKAPYWLTVILGGVFGVGVFILLQKGDLKWWESASFAFGVCVSFVIYATASFLSLREIERGASRKGE